VPGADVVFLEHRQGVFRYLCRLVGQSETARDLTQEVFLRAARAEVPEDAGGRRAWVFRIARNLALNHLRDRGRQPLPAAMVDTPRPATQELRVLLNQALAALPDLDRDVFVLRESVGLSYEEIAAACETTIAAVRARLHRARLALRDHLTRPAEELQRTRGIQWRSSGHDVPGPIKGDKTDERH
jgi:RNA polymerase sigma-70 factor (ECF subfamily)